MSFLLIRNLVRQALAPSGALKSGDYNSIRQIVMQAESDLANTTGSPSVVNADKLLRFIAEHGAECSADLLNAGALSKNMILLYFPIKVPFS